MEEGNFHDRLFKVFVYLLFIIHGHVHVLYFALIKRPLLLWKQRSSILKDVCRGLAWLHATVPPIIHGDVKMLVDFILADVCTCTTTGQMC